MDKKTLLPFLRSNYSEFIHCVQVMWGKYDPSEGSSCLEISLFCPTKRILKYVVWQRFDPAVRGLIYVNLK
jgi:hypothetical protein